MYNLQRKHNKRTLKELRDGWTIGEWEGEPVHFLPSMRFGQPAVTAHGLTQMVWKELATFGPNPPKALYFSRRQLMAATGKSWSTANLEAGETALGQIKESYLKFRAVHPETGKVTTEEVSLFQQRTTELDDETGQTESVVLKLSDFAHDCLVNKDVLLFNWDRLAELGNDPIAINLAKYFTARGFKLMNRKTGEPAHFSRRTGYAKDYGDVCDEFLGGLTHQKSKSRIEEQLSRAFKKIHRARIGAMYVKKSKTTKSGFNIHFKPLDGFYNDYNALLRSPKRRTPAHDKVHQENEDKTAPVLLASYFHERMGRGTDHTLLKKEVSYLSRLTDKYVYTDIEKFIEYVAKICTKNGNIPERATVLSTWEQSWETHQAERARRSAEKQTVASCSLCGADGRITLHREDGTPISVACPHDQSSLVRMAAEKGMYLPAHIVNDDTD